MNLGFVKRYKRFRVSIKNLLVSRTALFRVLGPYGETIFYAPLFSIGSDQRIFEPFSFRGHLKTTFQRLFTAVKGLFSPFRNRVSIYGTGYKAYCPKVFKRVALIFRVGFGGAEIGAYVDSYVKARARKQKIVLCSPFQDSITSTFSRVLSIKRPDPYKAKGVRNPYIRYVLKPGKVRANR